MNTIFSKSGLIRLIPSVDLDLLLNAIRLFGCFAAKATLRCQISSVIGPLRRAALGTGCPM